MGAKLKATLPLAFAIAVLSFLYVEFTANFTFHWVTSGNLGNGLHLPSNFHLVIPAGFIAWGLFFALGANNEAAGEVAANCLFGCLAALVLFVFVDIVKGVPDFWAISLGVGLLAFVIVLFSGAVTLINVPVIFCTFAACVLWWIATGLDGWAPNGGGVGNSVAALAKPADGRHRGLRRGALHPVHVRRAQRVRDAPDRSRLRDALDTLRRAAHPGWDEAREDRGRRRAGGDRVGSPSPVSVQPRRGCIGGIAGAIPPPLPGRTGPGGIAAKMRASCPRASMTPAHERRRSAGDHRRRGLWRDRGRDRAAPPRL